MIHIESLSSDKEWCCAVVKIYSDIIPGKTLGTFTNGIKQKEWKDKNCFSVVGGSGLGKFGAVGGLGSCQGCK